MSTTPHRTSRATSMPNSRPPQPASWSGTTFRDPSAPSHATTPLGDAPCCQACTFADARGLVATPAKRSLCRDLASRAEDVGVIGPRRGSSAARHSRRLVPLDTGSRIAVRARRCRSSRERSRWCRLTACSMHGRARPAHTPWLHGKSRLLCFGLLGPPRRSRCPTAVGRRRFRRW